MHRTSIRTLTIAFALLTAFIMGSSGAAVAHGDTLYENPPANPIDLPCATNAFAQVLGATPVGDGAQTMVQARVILEQGGSILAHTHPGTLIVSVESGSFGFTHLGDGEMSVNRSATTESESVAEALPHGEEVALAPGDWFVESGMIHTGVNLADGQTTVLISGLIETGQPLTICVDEAAPTTHVHAIREG